MSMSPSYSELTERYTLWFVIMVTFSNSDAFDVNFGVVIFRLRAGFDATEQVEQKG